MGILCLFSAVSAQFLSPLQIGIRKGFWAYTIKTDAHEGADGVHYIYSPNMDLGKAGRDATDCFFTVNVNENYSTMSTGTRPKDFSPIASFENDDYLLVYYEVDDSKNKTYTIYSNQFFKNDKQHTWDPSKVLSIPYERRDNMDVFTSVSPDKSTGMICVIQSQRKGAFKGSRLITFDNRGNILMNVEPQFDVPNESFGVLDMEVDNTGVVYAGVYSYNPVSKDEHANRVLQICQITDGKAVSQSKNINFNISNGKMRVGNSGNVYLGGYTCSDLKNNEDGTYIATYNSRTEKLETVSHRDFSSDYKENFAGGVLMGYCQNQSYAVVARDLYEFSNGTAALLGELRMTITVYSQNAPQTYYFVKHIAYAQTDSTGEIATSMLFDRRAVGGGFNMITYTPLFANDTIYLMFPDNRDNYFGKEGVPFRRLLLGKGKNYCCTLVTIDNSGKADARMLFDYKQCKSQVVRPLYVEADGFVVLDCDKKSTNISKLKVEW